MKTNKTIIEDVIGEDRYWVKELDGNETESGCPKFSSVSRQLKAKLQQALKTVEDRERGLIKVKITDAIGAYTFNDSPLSLSEFLEELIAITTNNNE